MGNLYHTRDIEDDKNPLFSPSGVAVFIPVLQQSLQFSMPAEIPECSQHIQRACLKERVRRAGYVHAMRTDVTV